MPRISTLLNTPVLKVMLGNKSNLAVLHKGGPAPGGNQVIYAARMRASDYGLPIIAFREGYEYLCGHSVEKILAEIGQGTIAIDREVTRYLRDQHALLAGTARTDPSKAIKSITDMADPAKTQPLTYILDVFEALRIGALISIGGDDTMTTAFKLQTHFENLVQQGRSFEFFKGLVHIPKTIDKDYPGIDFTFGYLSAANFLGKIVEGLHSDAKASSTKSQLTYHMIEIQGRKAGWLAAAAAIAGQATLTIVPEQFLGRKDVSLKELADMCVDAILTRRNQGKRYGVIVIAEGLGELIDVEVGQGDHGHKTLSNIRLADRLAAVIEQEIKNRVARAGKEEKLKMKVVPNEVCYASRQVEPIIYDELLCKTLGFSAVDAIVSGNFSQMISVTGVFEPRLVPIASLVDQQTMQVNNWTMDPNSGLYRLLRAMEQPFESDVELP